MQLRQMRRAMLTDKIVQTLGSWNFIIGQLCVLVLWISFGFFIRDPYPYLFLNLALGVVSSLSAPLIMMSQLQQEKRDSTNEMKDLATDMRNEHSIGELLVMVQRQEEMLTVVRGMLQEQVAYSFSPRRSAPKKKEEPDHGKEK